MKELRKASYKHEFELSHKRMGGALTIKGEEGHTKKKSQPVKRVARGQSMRTRANDGV